MTPELQETVNKIEDYIGGNFDPRYNTDWMALTVFLKNALQEYAAAYLDEAIRKCVPNEKCSNVHSQTGASQAEGFNQCIDELLSNIERFKKGEMT